MLKDVRLANGLVDVTLQGERFAKPFTTNSVENVNYQLSQWMKGKKKTIPEFIRDVRGLLQIQDDQYAEAVAADRDVHFSEQYDMLKLEGKWWQLSVDERSKYLGKVKKIPVRNTGSIADETARKNIVISLEDLTIGNLSKLPESVAEGIIHNARRLVTSDLVRAAFNSNNEYEVARQQTCIPLIVKVSKNGSVACKKKDCLDFAAFNICAHVLAVAAYTGT